MNNLLSILYRRIMPASLLAALMTMPSLGMSAADEYQLKAVFLLRFTQFITWPEEAFESEDSEFQICVYETHPFEDLIELAIDEQSIGEHKLVFNIVEEFESLKACQMIFISRYQEDVVTDIVKQVYDLPILIVSDADGSVHQGVMINFYQENSKIRLKVNRKRAESSNLAIPSAILQLSQICDESSCRSGAEILEERAQSSGDSDS